MFGNRDQLRSQFLDAWDKAQAGGTLNALETQIVTVIQEHPEYHHLFGDREHALQAEFPPEAGQTNPFLHLAMHLSIREQAATDRPAGIRAIYQRLGHKLGVLEAEHLMLECLGQVLWEAQRKGTLPDDQIYLDCLHRCE